MRLQTFFKLGLISLVLLPTVLVSQNINVSLVFPPPAPSSVEALVKLNGQAIVTLSNAGAQSQSLKLLVSLDGNNGVKANMTNDYVPSTIITLGAGESKVLTGSMLNAHYANLTENHLQYSGVTKNTILQTEKLPEGVYTICVKAYDYNTGVLLSSSFGGCTTIMVTQYDPPMILLPTHNGTVLATQPTFTTMSWTPSGIPGTTRYKMELVDMDLNHLLNPNEAFDNPAIILHFKKDNLITTNFVYDASLPKLTPGHHYAMRVTAYDPQNKLNYKNKGKSPVISFLYKFPEINNNPPKNNGLEPGNFDVKNNNQNVYSLASCQQNINIADNVAIAGNGIIKKYDVITIGQFKLKLTEVNWNNTTLSGKGKIIQSWFKVPILVEFTDLKINKNKIVIDGSAIGRNDNNVPSDWINDLGNISFGGPQIEALFNKLLGSPQRVMTWPYENMDSIGLGMPIGIKRNFGGADQTIAIVGMVFSAKGAGLNAVSQVKMPAYNQKISVAASGVCIDEKGFTKEALLYLIEELTLNQNGNLKLKLFEGEPGNLQKGTYLKMDTKGFAGMQLDGKFVIDSKVAKPVDPQLSSVDAVFKITVENPSNFILNNISVTPFTLVKLPEFQMTVSGLSIDHSDLQNPDGITFPSPGYNDKGNLWQGFYLKNITVKIPSRFHNNQTISCQHFVIDQAGFSGMVDVPIVFDKNKGEMGEKKWKYSMKGLYIKIIKNQFNEGKFNGEIRVPVTSKDLYLTYHASMSLNANNKLLYNLTLTNQNDITFPAIFAKGSINPDTELQLKDEGNGFDPELHLYATLTFNRTYSYEIQGFNFDISDVEVQDLIISKDGVAMGPNGGFSHSYESDQRSLNGFDISIDTFYFKKKNQMYVGFSISLVGEDNAVGGNAGFTVNTSYQPDHMMTGAIQLQEIGIHGDISVATIDGKIVIMEDDPVYGNGFKGSVSVKLNLGEKGSSIGGSVNIIFGKMPALNNVDPYRYFFFKGEMFAGNGIPLTASLRMYGLMGGIYYNMTQDDPWVDPVPYKESNADSKFGLLAGVDIGLVAKRAFHAKPQFKVQFGTQSGLDIIQIFGDAYAFTEWQPTFIPYDESTTPIHISMNAKLDFKKKVFDFDSGISIKYPVAHPLIEAEGTIKMHVAGSKKWYIKIGEPGPSTNIGVKLTFLPLKKKHYFMAGYDLPGMPPIPQEIQEKLDKPYIGDRTDVSDGENENLRFALGSLMDFSTGDLNAWIFYANFAAIMGYDVAMSNGWGDCGFNSWYIEGRAYAMLSAEVGIKAKIFKKERKFKVASLTAGIIADAALPNPTWFHGTVFGEATFLGIIKGKFTFEVDYGTKCSYNPNPKNTDALEGLKYVQDISPKGNNVKVFTDPEISLLFSSKENKIYTLQEYENDKLIERKFRFPVKQAVVKIDDASSKENGKILAKWGDNASYEGYWKTNNTGDILSYYSKKALPPKTKIRVIAEVEVWENIGGNFKSIEANGTKKELVFTTAEDPDRIVDENIEELYPANGQRYYLQNDRFQKGYIQLKDDQDNIFVSNGPAMMAPAFKVKLIPVGGGQVLEGKFEGYQNNRVSFSHPKLANNKTYVFQLIKVNLGGTFTSNENIEKKELQFTAAEFKTNLTQEQKLLNELKTSIKEKEIYKFIFRTSMYNSLNDKLSKINEGTGQLQWIGQNATAIKATFSGGMEAFDAADVAQLHPEWYLGQTTGGPAIPVTDKGKTFAVNYQYEKIIKPWNEILIPEAYPNLQPLKINYNAYILNAQPLISQQEINAMLKQPSNPGFNIASPPAMVSQEIMMTDCGIAHMQYNQFMAKMLDPETKGKAALNNIMGKPKLYTFFMSFMFDADFRNAFKPPVKGSYHLILHRDPAYHYRKTWKL